MPITYEVDQKAERVRVVGSGDIRIEDLVALLSELAEKRCLTCTQLFDARRVTLVLSAEEIRRLVALTARLREEHGNARTAFVAESDVTFGLARMYATLAADSDGGFMVYRTMEDGAAWLGWHSVTADQPVR
jgi:energy-converting hydrogenase Eha subunit H